MSKRYGYGSTTAYGDQAESFVGLLETFQGSQALIEQALQGLTGSDPDKKLSREMSRYREDDGHQLEHLVWHETHHTGQAILYRRLAEKAVDKH